MKVLARDEVRAVLGPTNSGKTHRAIQRMLAHRSGMIGLPLRLLAREVYDKVREIRGSERVALITGEEKIIPREPRYYVCTVEAMPTNVSVAFLAVDEVQLAQSPDRGHTFTDRILGSRGLLETWFLGAETMAPILERLVPGIVIDRQPRLSTLRYSPPKKLTSLPPRTAVVAFSMSEVYELAERLKTRHGGAAVVLGALSPRTRNAQVAMYQAGEVQHLVATDAIGMGLNLDIDHVAFASLVKFDGRERRPLAAHEVAQIAGRAGRYSRDGTFGVTAGEADLDPDVVRAVEQHAFPDVRRVVWRNAALDFHSVDALVSSLARTPTRGFMDLVRSAYDTDALLVLAADPVVRARARDEAGVRLLWDVCQIPDYRKTLTDSHTILLKQIHERLSTGVLPAEWIAEHLAELDRPRADIETLMARIAAVRTWSFVSFRGDWVSDPEELQARTRTIEDRLSDALHEALTTRFVDRKGLVLVRPREPDRAARQAGAGGLSFGQALVQSVGGPLVEPIVLPTQVERILAALDSDFSLGADGAISFEGAKVAWLRAGRTPAVPILSLGSGDPSTRKAVHARLDAYVRAWLARHLGELAIESNDAGVRGLSHALVQGLGSVGADEFARVLGSLRPRDRKALARAGIRLGRDVVYASGMLSAERVAARAILTAVHFAEVATTYPVAGAPPAVAIGDAPRARLPLLGYAAVGPWALRHDVYESAQALVRRGRSDRVRGLLGALESEAPAIVAALGDRRRARAR